MNKGNWYKVLYVISALLIIIFAIILGLDYKNYNSLTNSAPFTADILVRALEFILPSIILFIIGVTCKKKYSK